jgi:magnesium-protoporphyrin O-methyltransferase
MNCSQCQGIEELFSQKYVDGELRRYRTKGADQTTRMLTKAIQKEGVEGMTLLDIGGGVGAIQHGLLSAGVKEATSVEASSAYLNAAQDEVRRRGLADRVNYVYGNFVDQADEIEPADIVTLDRVICCYDDMNKLVDLSAARARKWYGLVYPRDEWWVKVGLYLMNIYFRLRRSPYRAFVHPTRSVEALVKRYGFKRHFYHQTWYWQVVVFNR